MKDFYPEYITPFTNWLFSLNGPDFITNKYNGYSVDKVFKNINDLFEEWYNDFDNKKIVRKKKLDKLDQEKCLSNLDELIKLQEEKVELLKKHKKGLIQHFEKIKKDE